ncbi:MAG: hypothetical protein RIS41_140, partial [Actinomycetota bacterium]
MGWLIVGAALLPACSASAVPSSSVELPPGSNLESTASTSEPDTVPEATLPFPYDGDCEYMNMKVDAPLEAAEGAFTVSPFDLSTIRMFINGSEGN